MVAPKTAAAGSPTQSEPVPAPEAPADGAADAATGAAAGAAADNATARSGRSRVTYLVAAALVALTGFGGVLATQWLGQRDDEATRAEVLQVGRLAVLDLTTLHHETADQDVARLLDRGTDAFRAHFAQDEQGFVDFVREGRVDTRGEVLEAAVERADDHTARVLVAARSLVTFPESADTETREYRLAVELERVEDRWLVSDLEFL